jgi:hypothetical protein
MNKDLLSRFGQGIKRLASRASPLTSGSSTITGVTAVRNISSASTRMKLQKTSERKKNTSLTPTPTPKENLAEKGGELER